MRAILLATVIVFSSCHALFAQERDDLASGDAEWKAIQENLLPPSARFGALAVDATLAEREQANTLAREHFVSVAERAHEFCVNYPNHPKAAEAALVETKSLLKASLLGQRSLESRYSPLVEAVRRDTTIAIRDRFEVLALSEDLLVRSIVGDRNEMRIAAEASARYLIDEFPTQEGGYLDLLVLAESTGDPRQIATVAEEVLGSPAPFPARALAEVLAGRVDLIGHSLADIANTALGEDSYFEQCREKQVLLYAWSARNQPSVDYAKEQVAKAPRNVLVIGINLDPDFDAAKQFAEKASLPGWQFYHEGSIGSPLALLLKLNSAPLAYITDDSGIIQDVTAHRGSLQERLEAVVGNERTLP